MNVRFSQSNISACSFLYGVFDHNVDVFARVAMCTCSACAEAKRFCWSKEGDIIRKAAELSASIVAELVWAGLTETTPKTRATVGAAAVFVRTKIRPKSLTILSYGFSQNLSALSMFVTSLRS